MRVEIATRVYEGLASQWPGRSCGPAHQGIGAAPAPAGSRADHALTFHLRGPDYKGDSMIASQQQFPRGPVAKTMADLVTPKQLVAIRAIANSQGVNAEAECLEALKCRPEELSRRAASAFIDHLKSKPADNDQLRRAGTADAADAAARQEARVQQSEALLMFLAAEGYSYATPVRAREVQ